MVDQEKFIKKLEAEALIQAKLRQKRILPDEMSSLANFVVRHSWQTILFISFLTALLLRLSNLLL